MLTRTYYNTHTYIYLFFFPKIYLKNIHTWVVIEFSYAVNKTNDVFYDFCPVNIFHIIEFVRGCAGEEILRNANLTSVRDVCKRKNNFLKTNVEIRG